MYINIKIKTFLLCYSNEELIISYNLFKREFHFSIEKELNGLSALFG